MKKYYISLYEPFKQWLYEEVYFHYSYLEFMWSGKGIDIFIFP
jgi:hypothetical protein